jgi:hypothetical protein
MSTRSMFVVFDLDGTLALNEHRQHFVDRPVGQKDWRGFFAACDRDTLLSHDRDVNAARNILRVGLERQPPAVEIAMVARTLTQPTVGGDAHG